VKLPEMRLPGKGPQIALFNPNNVIPLLAAWGINIEKETLKE